MIPMKGYLGRKVDDVPYITRMNNPYGEGKVIESCALFGMMSTSGRTFNGADAIKAITNMHDRGNGLGGGYAAYGLYPEFKDSYALHIMYMSPEGKRQTEALLPKHFDIDAEEEIPHDDKEAPPDPPELYRYFVSVPKGLEEKLLKSVHSDNPLHKGKEGAPNMEVDNYVVRKVMEINTGIDDAFIFSSGKNMGVFKGLGFPEEVGRFFKLTRYKAYTWVAHSRFPTNTQGWWGGAHPFNILDWTVVHNGEISSYGINRRYLEMYGYHCTMHTDTEVMAYAADLLMRKHRLPIEVVADILAPPLWSQIDRMDERKRAFHRYLRNTYGSLLMNGPFTIILSHNGEMIGLTDRIRLRPLTGAFKGEMVFLSSEEAAIRLVEPNLDKAWIPMGGEPVVGRLTDDALDEHGVDASTVVRGDTTVMGAEGVRT
jgi:glutamate synthase domain-containing protein 1